MHIQRDAKVPNPLKDKDTTKDEDPVSRTDKDPDPIIDPTKDKDPMKGRDLEKYQKTRIKRKISTKDRNTDLTQ